ncbi:uncharacterized protein LOC133530077 isoform X1 [Cydia pomonella]|uniref:uncharacterized protein LOC133530077 isoform X1 n=1 Tax=Cydia pomonella TaxID=82600 RepID=UPI002ADDEBF9|nr:uncharacterized protein LOC133530077 isoform X1 [Cydia pomonella]
MSFDVDRYSSAWAHIALCADLTWATEPPDDFIIANQRLWAQHCRVSQVLQDSTDSQSSQSSNQCEQTEKRSTSSQSQENGGCSRKSVKDIIPESRLAQFYGNFYYDEAREKSYANANEKSSWRGYNGQGCENSDLTECWMLPEVEYWFRKLLDDAPERACSRRRHRVPSDDFERWGPCDGAEAALSARVRAAAVRALWAPRAPPPPPPPPAPGPPSPPRKMRARRRQPRRLPPRAPLPAYCLAPALLCDPKCKFQFEAAPSPLCQRACRLPTLCRAAPYRGTTVCRYAPTNRRMPERRLGQKDTPKLVRQEVKEEKENVEETKAELEIKEKVLDDQQPTTSAAAMDGLRKKRLYSTVLSMSAPSTMNLQNCVRLQKFTPGLLKLNPKIIPVIRENKFEELEKEALEQYKASDESIDTKFKELEKQAEEQYSTSNSNTSCSSGEKKATNPESPKRAAKFHKEKVDSVMIYSQNFPDLNSKTASVTNLKNFHTPPRGEKKDHQHTPNKRTVKNDSLRAASDTDEAREAKSHKSSRWTLHVVPKKRHMTLCVSDFSSDEEMEDSGRSIKDAGPCIKHHLGMHSAHGGGDLIMRKT